MVDEQRVARLLQRVHQNLVYLRSRAAMDRGVIRSDVDRLGSLKYHLQVTIEGCLDLALHLGASEGWGPPTNNADAMRVLARNGVLEPTLGEAMADAVRFRNVLVHQYADVDDDLVVAKLDRLGDLEGFVAALSAWVEAHREPPPE